MYQNSSQLQQRRKRPTDQQEAESYVIRGSNATTVDSNENVAPAAAMAYASSPNMTMSNASRDRTNEFLSAVRSFQGRQMNGGMAGRPPPPPPTSSSARKLQLARQSGEFMTIARSIGNDISASYAKLEKLTLLARRKTMFDDRPREIQELTFIIKEDMNALNRQIGQLQQIAKTQRSQGLQGRHQQSHTSSVVFTLQSKLASMTSNFKEVLEVRTENLKEGKSRQEMFAHQGAVTSSMPQSAVSGYHSGSVLAAAMADDNDRTQRTGEVAISMGGVADQQRSFLQADATDQYLASRADTMQNIETTIVELGGIFSQLAHMIKEQEEIMVRIDGNVEETAGNVEAGHGEILKYFQGVTNNRWLFVKVFGVLIFFFILFVVFMA